MLIYLQPEIDLHHQAAKFMASIHFHNQKNYLQGKFLEKKTLFAVL